MQTDSSRSPGRIRFAEFEVDPDSRELLRSGRKVRLQGKSFLVLQELLRSPGRVVPREELAAALWPKEHFVDAEHGLNTAVRRLREALGDSAEDARFVETVPKLGYRFVGTLDAPPELTPEAPPAPSPARGSPPPTTVDAAKRRAFAAGAILVAVAVALAVAAGVAVRALPSRSKAGPAASAAPSTAEAVEELVERSRYLRNVKRSAEAKAFLERALERDPRNPAALGGLALSLLGEGEIDQSRETARRALEIDPSAFEAHRALGVLARGAGDFAGAERHFRRAADAAPEDYKTRNRLARHLLECGRFADAKALILETKRLAPDDPDVQNIRMEYALRTGDYESAIRQGEVWIAVWAKQIDGPPTPTVREMLALAYVGARRHEDAVAQFRAIDPDDELRVALSLAHAGRAAEARAILDNHEGGSAADPGRSGAMAMAYVPLGDFDRAFAHLERQVAARWHPGWLNCSLFHALRRDARWPPFAKRLEREFFAGAEGETFSAAANLLQYWPRPAKRAPGEPGKKSGS